MKATFYKGIVLGAAVSMLVLVASTAVAGTGIGGIFNLGQSNTVNATSGLSGATVGPQLQVSNSSTGQSSQSIAGYNNSTKAAALYARNNGGGPAAAFSVQTGKAPFAVTPTSGKVNFLNSDLLDGLDASSFLRKGVDETADVSSAGGVLSVTNTGTSNGVQGLTGDANSSGVYGQNTSGGGYGIAGRAGASGYGVFGDNTGTGWAGYFTGKTHITGALELGGALNCTECVSAGNVAGGYVQGGGKAEGRLNNVSQGTSEYMGGTIAGFLRLSYDCPIPIGNNGTLHLYNNSGEVANVFVDNGGTNPSFYYMPASGAGQEITFPASATGDWFHIQAQGPWQGILTIDVATFHHYYVCHADAQALQTGWS